MFRRKAQESTDKVGLAAPIVVESGDLDCVRSLMIQFNQGVGTDAGLRSFGIAFNRAGGFRSDIEALDAVRLIGPTALKRPWLWIAAVAREAAIQEDAMLVAQIALMTSVWDNQIAPKQRPADILDGIVDRISDVARAQIFSVALQVLTAMSEDAVVMENPTGVVKAGDILTVSANEVLAVEALVDVATVDLAREILAH